MNEKDKEKWLKEYEQSKQKKSCFNCKFYNSDEYVCERNYEFKCILSEDRTGQNCSYFKRGKYNKNDLEDIEDTIVGYVQY